LSGQDFTGDSPPETRKDTMAGFILFCFIVGALAGIAVQVQKHRDARRISREFIEAAKEEELQRMIHETRNGSQTPN
jgi:hypothetical protein